ncbi:uncharacterized protein VP01_15433g1, partial [Puccinia sorghi]
FSFHSGKKFDKKTLEEVWVFFIIKRLPPSFSVFRNLQFSTFKNPDTFISMSTFLTEQELELRRQQETASLINSSEAALAVHQPPNSNATLAPKKSARKPQCTKG